MAEPVTRPTGASVTAFLNAIEEEQKRKDSKALVALFKDVTGKKPEMWGPSIIGFGRYDMLYANGKTQEWLRVGFSPRKNDLTLYLMPGFEGRAELMARLGKHKTGKSCLYLKKLADVDAGVLRAIIEGSVRAMAPRRIGG